MKPIFALLVVLGLAGIAIGIFQPGPEPITGAEDETAALPKDETVVVYKDATDIQEAMTAMGYGTFPLTAEELQAVPRLSIGAMPKTVSAAWKDDVALRKSLFYRLMLSGVLEANEMVLADRQRLITLRADDLTDKDSAWLKDLMARYNIAETESPKKAIDQLKVRVDIVPPSLALAQAAIESAWAQSRFSREGQALFGQWTTSESGMKAQRSDAKLAAFKTPLDSILAYMRNLNTHRSYRGFREERAEMRAGDKVIDGYRLARHLEAYAEKKDYVALIRSMIDQGKLKPTDQAKLADGPITVLRHAG